MHFWPAHSTSWFIGEILITLPNLHKSFKTAEPTTTLQNPRAQCRYGWPLIGHCAKTDRQIPADFGPKKSIEHILEENANVMGKGGAGDVVPHLSLSASLELFQFIWGQFFDGHGLPTRVMAKVLQGI